MRGTQPMPPEVTLGSLRMLNTYEAAGVFEGRCSQLDELILEHLTVVRAMTNLDAYQETLCRLVAEGYSGVEIARELGASQSTVYRTMRKIRLSLYGIHPEEARA